METCATEREMCPCLLLLSGMQIKTDSAAPVHNKVVEIIPCGILDWTERVTIFCANGLGNEMVLNTILQFTFTVPFLLTLAATAL